MAQRKFRLGVAGAVFLAALGSGPGAAVARAEAGDAGKPAEGHAEGEAGKHEEGVVELTPAAMDQLGLKVLVASSATIKVTLQLPGTLTALEDQVAHVNPRFTGVIREVRKRLGDPVAKGETLAIVENSQTLQAFEVKSQLAGMVSRRHATVGESVTDATTIFEIADYSELYADFFVFPAEFGRVRVGQPVLVRFPDEDETYRSTISFRSPVTDPETQSRYVRAVLPNQSAAHQPGMFVTGDVILEEAAVPLAVHASAVRTKDGAAVVFVEDGPGRFQARPVLLGRKDRDGVEVLKGLKPGDRYAAGNTFILLAELGKGEAEHDD